MLKYYNDLIYALNTSAKVQTEHFLSNFLSLFQLVLFDFPLYATNGKFGVRQYLSVLQLPEHN